MFRKTTAPRRPCSPDRRGSPGRTSAPRWSRPCRPRAGAGRAHTRACRPRWRRSSRSGRTSAAGPFPCRSCCRRHRRSFAPPAPPRHRCCSTAAGTPCRQSRPCRPCSRRRRCAGGRPGGRPSTGRSGRRRWSSCCPCSCRSSPAAGWAAWPPRRTCQGRSDSKVTSISTGEASDRATQGDCGRRVREPTDLQVACSASCTFPGSEQLVQAMP